MKGLKFSLCGLGLILVAMFCLIASGRNYNAALAFGIIFVILGIALLVLGILVKDSLSELKRFKIVDSSKHSDKDAEENAKEDDKN